MSAPPTALVATSAAQSGTVLLNFTASTDVLVINYTIYALPNITPISILATEPLPITIAGLTNGVSYTFFMTATNSLGQTSVFSANSNNAIPGAAPSPPTDVTAIVDATNGSVNVSFNPGDNGGYPVSGYTCTAIPNPSFGGNSPVTTSQGTTINVTGLTNGLTYTFTVTATNAIGTSESSFVSNQILTLPDPPTNLSATAGDASATLTLTPPPAPDFALGPYLVTIIPNVGESYTTTFDGSLTSYTITDLTNGLTYTFQVLASNVTGLSCCAKTSNNVTPTGTPSAPLLFTATRGNQSAALSWQIPASTGGINIPITSYNLTVSQGGFPLYADIIAGTIGTYTLNGLTNGILYSLTLTATNRLNTGPAAIATVTPSTNPQPPTITAVAAANQFVIVYYTPPVDNGGAAITQYTASATAGPSIFTATQTNMSASSVTIPGLTNGIPYTISLYARNIVGNSAIVFYASNPVTPVSTPGAPTAVTATQTATNTVRIDWVAPTNTGGAPLSTYDVVCSDPFIPTVTVAAPTTTTTIGGLVNGLEYTFTVYAYNTLLPTTPSLPSNQPSITPTGPSDPPTDVMLQRSGTQGALAIFFSVPTYTGGAAIVSYTVYAYDCDAFGNQGSLVYTFTGVQYGDTLTGYTFTNANYYCFTVLTVNASPFGQPALQSAPSSPIQAGTIPAAPTVTVTPTPPDGNLYIQLAYNSDGGIPISGFSGYLSNSEPYLQTFSSPTPYPSEITITGLTNGTTYYVAAIATNAAGDSLYSSNVIGIPSTVPEPPTIGPAVAGHNQVSVSLTPNGNGGAPITSYTAYAYFTSSLTYTGISATSIGPPIVVTGLTNGVFYTFTVTANNLQGSSGHSGFSQSVQPFITVPDAPTIGIVLPQPSAAVVTFTPPYDDGGTPVTSYTIYKYPGGTGNIVGTTTVGSPFTVAGLTNGTEYQFAVSATNAQGESLLSGYSTRFYAANVPSTPRSVNAVPLDRQISVTFVGPLSNGGSPILYYTVYVAYNSSLQLVTGTSSPILVTGLTNGFPYEIRMSATNAIGESPLTAPPVLANPTGTVAGLGASALYPVGKWGSQLPLSLGTDVSGAVAMVAGPDESVYVAYASIGFTAEQSVYNIIVARLDVNGNVLWILNDPKLQTSQDSFTPVLALDATRGNLYLAFGTTGNVPNQTNMVEVPVFNPVSCVDTGPYDIVLAQINVRNSVPAVSWVKQDGYLNSCNNERNPKLVYDPVNQWIYIAYEATGPLEAYQFPSYAPAPLPSGSTQVVLSAFDVAGNRVGILQNYYYDDGTTRNYINCNGTNTNPTITSDISGNVFITLEQTANTRDNTGTPYSQGRQIEIIKIGVTNKTVRPVVFSQQLFNNGLTGYGPFYDSTSAVLMPQIAGGGQNYVVLGFLKTSQYYFARMPTSLAQVNYLQTGIYNRTPYIYSSVLNTNTTVDNYGRPYIVLTVINSVGDVWILQMRLDPANGAQVYSDGYGATATWNAFPFAFGSTPASRRSLAQDPLPNIPGYGIPAVACFKNTVYIAVPSPYLFIPGAFFAQPMLLNAPIRYMSVGAYNQLAYDPNITAFNYLLNYRSICGCGAGMCTCN